MGHSLCIVNSDVFPHNLPKFGYHSLLSKFVSVIVIKYIQSSSDPLRTLVCFIRMIHSWRIMNITIC